MNQVVMQDLELDRIPQSIPRAAEHSVNKLMPPLAEHRLDTLPHLREQVLLLRRVGSRNQQHLSLFQTLGTIWPAIAQITNGDAAINSFVERQRWLPVIPVGRRQDDVHQSAFNVTHGMKLETEEPALTCLAKARAVFSHQTH